MGPRTARCTLTALLAFLVFPASANDGAAGLDGGDLHFKNLKGVQMVEENLSISPTLVRVRYRFENKTAKPITTRISFPIRTDLGSDLNWDSDSKNPNDFTVVVNGQPRPFETTVRKTDEELVIQHHWEQVFPPAKVTEIEHTYVPIFETGVAYMMAGFDFGEGLQGHFCATPKEVAWVRKKSLKYWPLTYILGTARTWDGPIRSFRLRLEKGKYKSVFLCTDLKLTKTPDGTAFEATAQDFVPRKDLAIAFVGE